MCRGTKVNFHGRYVKIFQCCFLIEDRYSCTESWNNLDDLIVGIKCLYNGQGVGSGLYLHSVFDYVLDETEDLVRVYVKMQNLP